MKIEAKLWILTNQWMKLCPEDDDSFGRPQHNRYRVQAAHKRI